MSTLPTRVCDYFVVVGGVQTADYDATVNNTSTINGNDIIENDNDALQSNNNYAPSILHRYPSTDHMNASFPSDLAMFCFPAGYELQSQPYNNTLLYGFALTEQDGTRLYVYALCSTVPINTDNDRALTNTMYAPIAVCLVSHWPFHTQLSNWLTQFSTIIDKNIKLSEPIERILCNLIYETPLPPQGQIQVEYRLWSRYINTLPLVFTRPAPNKLPLNDIDLSYLFQHISVEHIVAIFSCILVERKCVFVSSEYNRLMMITECLLYLIQPFSYQSVYIPVLPLQLIDFLSAPMSYIIGINRSYMPDDSLLTDILIVDIDNDSIYTPLNTVPVQNLLVSPVSTVANTNNVPFSNHHASVPSYAVSTTPPVINHDPSPIPHKSTLDLNKFVHPLPVKQHNVLLATLCRLTIIDTSTTISHNTHIDNTLITDAFLNFFIDLLCNYTDYIDDTISVDDGTDRFDRLQFLHDHHDRCDWLTEFVDSQLFQSFIDYRCDTADIVLLDELIKVNYGKLSPFISDNSQQHNDTYVVMMPNTDNLPSSVSYTYSHIPTTYDEQLYDCVRSVEPLCAPPVVTVKRRNTSLSAQQASMQTYTRTLYNLRMTNNRASKLFTSVILLLNNQQSVDSTYNTQYNREICSSLKVRPLSSTNNTKSPELHSIELIYSTMLRHAQSFNTAFNNKLQSHYMQVIQPLTVHNVNTELQLKYIFIECGIYDTAVNNNISALKKLRSSKMLLVRRCNQLRQKPLLSTTLNGASPHIDKVNAANDKYSNTYIDLLNTVLSLYDNEIEYDLVLHRYNEQVPALIQTVHNLNHGRANMFKQTMSAYIEHQHNLLMAMLSDLGELANAVETIQFDSTNIGVSSTPHTRTNSISKQIDASRRNSANNTHLSLPNIADTHSSIDTTPAHNVQPATPTAAISSSNARIDSNISPSLPDDASYTLQMYNNNSFTTIINNIQLQRTCIKQLLSYTEQLTATETAYMKQLQSVLRTVALSVLVNNNLPHTALFQLLHNRFVSTIQHSVTLINMLQQCSNELTYKKIELKQFAKCITDYEIHISRLVHQSDELLARAQDRLQRFTSTSTPSANPLHHTQLKQVEFNHSMIQYDNQRLKHKQAILHSHILQYIEINDGDTLLGIQNVLLQICDAITQHKALAVQPIDDQVTQFVHNNPPTPLASTTDYNSCVSQYQHSLNEIRLLKLLFENVVSANDTYSKSLHRLSFSTDTTNFNTLNKALEQLKFTMNDYKHYITSSQDCYRAQFNTTSVCKAEMKSELKLKQKIVEDSDKLVKQAVIECDRAVSDEQKAQSTLQQYNARHTALLQQQSTNKKSGLLGGLLGDTLSSIQSKQTAAQSELIKRSTTMKRKQDGVNSSRLRHFETVSMVCNALRLIDDKHVIVINNIMMNLSTQHTAINNTLLLSCNQLKVSINAVNCRGDILNFINEHKSKPVDSPPEYVISAYNKHLTNSIAARMSASNTFNLATRATAQHIPHHSYSSSFSANKLNNNNYPHNTNTIQPSYRHYSYELNGDLQAHDDDDNINRHASSVDETTPDQQYIPMFSGVVDNSELLRNIESASSNNHSP